MKKKILNLLIWLIRKIDCCHLEKCSVGTKLYADFTHYVPDDKKWHHCAITVEYWLKVNDKSLIKEDIYMDGLRVSKTLNQ